MSRLDEIERRLAAATPGEWQYHPCTGFVVAGGEYMLAQTWSKFEEDFPNHERNGDLIAHAPADLHLLLAAAKTAERLMESLLEHGMVPVEQNRQARQALWAALAPLLEEGEDDGIGTA